MQIQTLGTAKGEEAQAPNDIPCPLNAEGDVGLLSGSHIVIHGGSVDFYVYDLRWSDHLQNHPKVSGFRPNLIIFCHGPAPESFAVPPKNAWEIQIFTGDDGMANGVVKISQKKSGPVKIEAINPTDGFDRKEKSPRQYRAGNCGENCLKEKIHHVTIKVGADEPRMKNCDKNGHCTIDILIAPPHH